MTRALLLTDAEADREERLAIILDGCATTSPSGATVCAISQARAERLADECVARYPGVAKAMGWRP